MIACVCAGVNEKTWRAACQSAASWQEAADVTGAGACCGCCQAYLHDLWQEEVQTVHALPLLTFPITTP